MKYNSIYNNFSSGELSRSLFGRTDLEEYFKGVAELTNFIPTRQGGASFRPGTVKVDAGSYTRAAAIFSFSPRDNEKYFVSLTPGLPIQINDSNAGSATVTQPSYVWNKRINFTDATTAWPTASGDNAAHMEKVDFLQVAASGDVMVVVDGTGELAPFVIIRKDINTFAVDSLIFPTDASLTPPPLLMRVPYKDPNIDTEKRLKVSAQTGTITITAQNSSAATISFFTGDVVGMLVKITHITATATGVAMITSKVSDSVVNATVLMSFGATTAESNFEVSYWNPVDGYPKSVCFHESRLVFGGNIKYPDTIWCSNTGNIYQFMQRRLLQDKTDNLSGLNFYGAVKATDPFNFIPAAVGANNIQWLYPADSLLVGTSGNEFSITGGQESALSVSSISIKNLSSHGSSKVQPIKVGSSVIFVSLDGKRILEIPKRLSDYTSATDWTGLSAGIVEKSIQGISVSPTTIKPLKSKITKMAWDEVNGTLWCITKNTSSDYSAASSITSLLSLTFDRTSKVVAWSKHNLAGKPFLTSVASVPDTAHTGMSRVYLFLKRSGAANYSQESFSYTTSHEAYLPLSLFAGGPPFSVFLDGSFFASTTVGVTNSIGVSNSHFPSGSTYGVIEVGTNKVGTYLGSYVESGGQLSIPNIDPLKSYIVGALYEGELRTMPIEAGAQFGVAQGSPRRTHEIVAFIDRGLGGVYKASKALNFFPVVGTKGTPDALYTGEVRLSLNASPDDTQITIKQTVPYPLTILWLLTKGYTYDV